MGPLLQAWLCKLSDHKATAAECVRVDVVPDWVHDLVATAAAVTGRLLEFDWGEVLAFGRSQVSEFRLWHK